MHKMVDSGTARALMRCSGCATAHLRVNSERPCAAQATAHLRAAREFGAPDVQQRTC
jgi:hypothetical protein